MVAGLLILALAGGSPLPNRDSLSLLHHDIPKRAARQSRLEFWDQLLRVGSSALIVGDWLTTVDGLRMGYRETNPLLGASPALGKANLMIGAGLVTNAFLVPKVKDRTVRKGIWLAVMLIEAKAVRMNMQTGLHFNFRF